MPEAVIIAAVRTPIGNFLGSLASSSTVDLGAVVVREAWRRCASAEGTPWRWRWSGLCNARL